MRNDANLSVNNYFSMRAALVTIPATSCRLRRIAHHSQGVLPVMSVAEKSVGHVALEAALRQVADAARAIRYGSIELVIHDGRIVQIERREKIRLGKDSC